MLLMFGPEYARACGIEALEPLGIYLPGDKNYPGKPLNATCPLSFAIYHQIKQGLRRPEPALAEQDNFMRVICTCRGRV